jgi:TPR repeat protein
VGPKIDEAQRFFALLMAASDAGDREALASFRPYYDVLHGQVFIEDVMSEPAAASAMAREFDKWLTEKALAGSPTAQYWMGERAGMVDHPGDESAGLIEIERWYRAAAEQGFAPAQSALGQILIMAHEFRREPFEPEKWLLQAVRQGEVIADQYLLWSIDVDSVSPGYAPSPEILVWLQQQSDTGDEKAKRLLTRLAPKN